MPEWVIVGTCLIVTEYILRCRLSIEDILLVRESNIK